MSPESLFHPGSFARSRTLTKSDRLLRVFEDIHNHIYANEGLSAEQTFAEMMKVLCLKVADEKAKGGSHFYVLPDELEAGQYQDFMSRIHALEQTTNENLAQHVNDSRPIGLKPPSLAYAVDRLQHISLLRSSRDVKGLAFQKFVNAEHRRGRGQFFTPEQVVSLCVGFLRPKAGERVLDPACGTGGFLSQAGEYMRRGCSDKAGAGIEPELVGIDISPMVATTAEVRLVLEDFHTCRSVVADALADWSILDGEINRSLRKNCTYEGYFDVILTNPPFGSQGRIRSAKTLARFDLGHKWNSRDGGFRKTATLQKGQVPDILFIERCLDLLRVGGRMAIVVPNGDLENCSLAYLRHYILRRARLMAVVLLPPDTFIPFGAGVKASVLFLEKTDEGRTGADEQVFFGHITKLGYQANKNGTVVYRRDSNGQLLLGDNGEQIIDEDYSVLVTSYTKYEETGEVGLSDSCFTVHARDVCDRFDLEYHRPRHRRMESWLVDKGARPLGEVAKIIKRRSRKLSRPELEVVYVELSDVSVEYSEINGGTRQKVYELPSRASYELHAGDVITEVAGNSTGTNNHMSALVTEEFEGAICTNGFRILQPKKGLSPYYLLYYLRTKYFLQQVYRYRTGAAIPAISDTDLARVLVYVPSPGDQERIAHKVRESFALRQQSRQIMKGIDLLRGSSLDAPSCKA